ncbi:MAG TPA: RcnB family protein [Rhizomicrobium sp.]|jgi:Ni/Co efflux regulator RcnB
MKLFASVTLALGVAAAPAAFAQANHHGSAPHGTPHPAMHAPSVHARVSVHTRPGHHVIMHHPVHVMHHHVVHHTVMHHVVHHLGVTTHRAGVSVRAHVDLGKFRHAFNAPKHFHAGAYREPPGYHYRRWGLGERLPGAFFARDYWLVDFGMYDLLAPPDGYVWVRYGPDALLIDEDTGEVISVEYGLFL